MFKLISDKLLDRLATKIVDEIENRQAARDAQALKLQIEDMRVENEMKRQAQLAKHVSGITTMHIKTHAESCTCTLCTNKFTCDSGHLS